MRIWQNLIHDKRRFLHQPISLWILFFDTCAFKRFRVDRRVRPPVWGVKWGVKKTPFWGVKEVWKFEKWLRGVKIFDFKSWVGIRWGVFWYFSKKSGILKWLFYLQTFWWNFQIFLMFGWFFSFDFKVKIIPIEPLRDNITRENFQKLWIGGWISDFGNKSGQSK